VQFWSLFSMPSYPLLHFRKEAFASTRCTTRANTLAAMTSAPTVEVRGYRMYPDTAATMMREPGYPILLTSNFALNKALTYRDVAQGMTVA